MLLEIICGIVVAWVITLLHWEQSSFWEALDGETTLSQVRLLLIGSPVLIWPIWAIWIICHHVMIGEIGLFGVIEATGHVIVIVFGAAIIAYIWNGFHTFFPGIMIGWGVYKFMMNDFQQTPFHYFYDLNAVIADWVFVNHPLPELLHIPIQVMVGFGFFFICINLVVNN